MAVYAPNMAFLWKVLLQRGIDPRPLFLEAGIDPAERQDTNARIDRQRYDRLFGLVVEKTQDRTFAFDYFSLVHPSFTGPLGYATLCSSSLRSALEHIQRFVHVCTEELNVALEDSGRDLNVIISWNYDIPNYPAHANFVSAWLLNSLRKLRTPEYSPEQMLFAYPLPADTTHHQRYYRCDLDFGRSHTALVLDSRDLDLPLDTADPEQIRLQDESLIRALARVENSDIRRQAEMVIRELLPLGNLTVNDVAERLHVSERTLRRRLDEAGISFRDLVGQVRVALAEQYIADPHLTLTEISYLLGFSEISAFSRAYKRWTGLSPQQSRAADAAG